MSTMHIDVIPIDIRQCRAPTRWAMEAATTVIVSYEFLNFSHKHNLKHKSKSHLAILIWDN